MISHLATIREMDCVLCEVLGRTQRWPTEAHHVRLGQGMSQKAHDALAIPLCSEDCHRGPCGVHGDKSLLLVAKVEEDDLLAMTVERLMGRLPKPRPAYKRPAKILPRGFPPRAA